MKNITGLIVKVDNFKENHLSIVVYSNITGKTRIVVFGGKSKKKNSSFTKGIISELEINKDEVCVNNLIKINFNWFSFNKYQLKTIDYFCYLIERLLIVEEKSSKVLDFYKDLINKLNSKDYYLLEFLALELEILRVAGYQPDLNKNVVNKIFKESNLKDQYENEEIIQLISLDVSRQKAFFIFLEKVLLRVLINLNIKLPFSRSETVNF